MATKASQNTRHTAESLEQLTASQPAALIYFFSNNCAPCVSLRPKVSELLNENFPEMRLLLVNAEDHRDVAARYGAFSFPTLIIYFDGREYFRASKYISMSQLAEKIGKPYQMLFEE